MAKLSVRGPKGTMTCKHTNPCRHHNHPPTSTQACQGYTYMPPRASIVAHGQALTFLPWQATGRQHLLGST